ncbi:MAG: hypothetical protein LBH18_07940 [Spirochaetaceae bacterium]|jgi:hypothetical protein|nr:hypothetical protein [Spirochaetaceae bacterium]
MKKNILIITRMTLLGFLIFLAVSCMEREVFLEEVPLDHNVITTIMSYPPSYHRLPEDYDGENCRLIEDRITSIKSRKSAMDEGFTPCNVCVPDKTITITKVP